MEETYNENPNSTNVDGSGESIETDEGLTGEENPSDPQLEDKTAEEITAEFKKLSSTNAKLYARAKKAEEALKGRKDSEIKTDSPDDPWKEKMEFIVKHKDFDEEQIDILSSFAKGKGVSLEDAFKDKLVNKVIAEDQTAKRIANATPEGKSKSSQYKDIQQQINEATDRESHKELWKELSKGGSKGVESE